MKRSLELLLVLPLLLAIIFLIFAVQNGTFAQWFAAVAPGATATSTVRATAPVSASVTPLPSPTRRATDVPTQTPRPSATSTRTATPVPTATWTSIPAPGIIVTVTDAALSGEINSGMERGNQIVDALEAFYFDQGRYPATLDELVPVYLPALPLTVTGQPYFYRLFSPSDILAPEMYWLSFRVVEQENVACTYLRRLQYWDCNFVSP
jgi:hypothetical protein